jgi:hypothetical protein
MGQEAIAELDEILGPRGQIAVAVCGEAPGDRLDRHIHRGFRRQVLDLDLPQDRRDEARIMQQLQMGREDGGGGLAHRDGHAPGGLFELAPGPPEGLLEAEAFGGYGCGGGLRAGDRLTRRRPDHRGSDGDSWSNHCAREHRDSPLFSLPCAARWDHHEGERPNHELDHDGSSTAPGSRYLGAGSTSSRKPSRRQTGKVFMITLAISIYTGMPIVTL